jgi:hypothetical protein
MCLLKIKNLNAKKKLIITIQLFCIKPGTKYTGILSIYFWGVGTVIFHEICYLCKHAVILKLFLDKLISILRISQFLFQIQ